jgi:NAD+ kinase
MSDAMRVNGSPIPANVIEQGRVKAPQRNQAIPRRVLLLNHPSVGGAGRLVADMADQLQAWGFQTQVASLESDTRPELFAGYDLVIALGGDGTMLHTNRLTAQLGVPVLGVNLGRLGFLAEVQPDEWRQVLERVCQGDYWIEPRLMLHAELFRGEQRQMAFDVLNEVVVSRGGTVRPVRLETYIDGGLLTTYVADALIIATPTGSTAYALAAGGPILPPDLKNILLLAVAPHLSIDRAIVLAQGSVVTVRVVLGQQEALISGDGAIERPMQDGDRVVVSASPHVARFVRVQDPSYFYRTLMTRMDQNPSAGLATNPNQ